MKIRKYFDMNQSKITTWNASLWKQKGTNKYVLDKQMEASA